MKKLLIIALIITNTSVFAGGPWTQPKGKGYFKLSEWWLIYKEHFTDVGLKDPNVTTGIFNTTIYADYGVTDRFTTTLYAPLFSRNFMNNLVSATTGDILVPGEALNNIGDIDLGFKYGITKSSSRIPIAASITLGIPTGQKVGGTQQNLQTGDGEFNQMVRLDAGRGFSYCQHINGYVSGYTGINHRTNGFSEEFRYGVEFGNSFFNQNLWLITRLNGYESFKNGTRSAAINSTSIFADQSEFLGFSFEVAYYISKVGISFGMETPIRGEIIAAAPSYSVGIFYDMTKK